MRSHWTTRAVCALFVSLMILTVSPISSLLPLPAIVRADSGPQLFIAPSHQGLVTTGNTVTFNVNVSNISPNDALVGWVIYVYTDISVLNATSFSLGSYLSVAVEGAHCINGACSSGDPGGLDGLGVVRSEVYTNGAGSSGNGTLFTITYTANNQGPYTFVSIVSPNFTTQLTNQLGSTILFAPGDGDYGNVPPLPLARFTFSPPPPLFAGESVAFNGSSSSDPSGFKISFYTWTFTGPGGVYDARQGTALVVTSERLVAGNWTVTLQVRNDHNILSRITNLALNVAVVPSIDLSVANGISVSPIDNILPGTIVTIKVSVMNLGTVVEPSFNVTVSAAGKVLQAPHFAGVLAPGYQKQFTYTWDTGGVAPNVYTVHAHVDPLPGDNNTSDKDAFATVRLIYPYQGASIPISFLQALGLALAGIIVMGAIIPVVRRGRNRRISEGQDRLSLN